MCDFVDGLVLMGVGVCGYTALYVVAHVCAAVCVDGVCL